MPLSDLLNISIDALGLLVDPILLSLDVLFRILRAIELLLMPLELLFQQPSASECRLFVAHACQRLQDVDFLLDRTVSAVRTTPPVPRTALLAEPFVLGTHVGSHHPAATSTSITAI